MFIDVCNTFSLTTSQNFVSQLTLLPNLKIDYVVLNAGVLRYPNASKPYMHTCQTNRTNALQRATELFVSPPPNLISARACISMYPS